MRLLLLMLSFLLFSCASAFAQGLSNKGKEFWVGYGHNYYMELASGNELDNSQELILYFSAEQPANVTVSINGTTWTRSYRVAANTVAVSDKLPKSGTFDCRLYSKSVSVGGTNSEGVFNRGIHIVSDVPIVAYAHIYSSQSSGATMLLPVETWGYQYVSLNYKQSPASDRFTWINIIASHDNTTIEITPSILTRSGRQPDVPFTVTLNKGQVYQMLSSTFLNSFNFSDLTGTKVTSVANSSGDCYPIAVFSGSSLTYMKFYCAEESGDAYIQQVFPSQAWGKRYLTAPTSPSTDARIAVLNAYRVLVKDPATVVKRNGVTLTGLTFNAYYDFYSNTPDVITADKPILVAQYISSQGSCYPGVGDPEMIYLSPVEQAITRAGFYRNNKYSINVNYLTLIIPTNGLTTLQVDGSKSFDYVYPHPEMPGYSVVVKRWAAATAQCLVSSDSAFTAITYGLGRYESYGYNAGTYINNLNAIGEIKNVYDTNPSPNTYTCRKTPFIPSVLIAYQPEKLVWQISQVPGLYPATDVTLPLPVATDTVMVKGVTYYRYRLPDSYTITDTGSYFINVLSTHYTIDNCNHTEVFKIPLLVQSAPATDFQFSNAARSQWYKGCTLDTVYFTASTATTPHSRRYRWQFSANAADTVAGLITHKIFNPGTYPVQLTAIAADGCINDTVKNIVVYEKPMASFTLSNDTICKQNTITATSAGTYNGSAAFTTWFWNNGNNQVQRNTTSTPVTFTYPNTGSFTLKHVVAISDLCVSDTAVRVVQVYERPVASFTTDNSNWCPDIPHTFTDASSSSDSPVNSWYWNFDDGTTAQSSNPVKAYQAAGTYRVRLSVTSKHGCLSDTATQNIRIYPIPVISAGRSFMVDIGTRVRFEATAINSTQLSFQWLPATELDNATLLTPQHVASSDQVFWLSATGPGGCIASDSLTITVLKPIIIPNVFSPNGDGIHDIWAISNLADYPNTTVRVFNRYGVNVFSSIGYHRSWDGTANGKPLPFGTYYYIIDLKNGIAPMNGTLTIVR